MASIILKGREIPLEYTTYEMKLIQEAIGPLGVAIKLATGRNPEDEKDMGQFGGAAHLDALAKLIVILGNAGLESAGKEPDLTEKAVLKGIRPDEIYLAVNVCMDAMTEGMKSEIPEEKKEGPVDVTLEEMTKKKEKES